jgi:two-component system, LytTR family, sensor histidine kinase AlgZ
MTTSAASPMIIKFFKLWTVKQQQWMYEQEEKNSAELQLLKAQVHPQFLFNALNSIHSFSKKNSSQTPGLILKLSSLLSYMLYDCKSEEVRLEKEIENMKNYIDLEKERHGNEVEVSWNVEGDIEDKMVAPLLFLPFLENAFKHGISEHIVKPWVGVDVVVNKGLLKFKIVNSKTDLSQKDNSSNGICNVKKRLEFLYPGKHELKINDDGDFFVVNMQVQLYAYSQEYVATKSPAIMTQTVPA